MSEDDSVDPEASPAAAVPRGEAQVTAAPVRHRVVVQRAPGAFPANVVRKLPVVVDGGPTDTGDDGIIANASSFQFLNADGRAFTPRVDEVSLYGATDPVLAITTMLRALGYLSASCSQEALFVNQNLPWGNQTKEQLDALRKDHAWPKDKWRTYSQELGRAITQASSDLGIFPAGDIMLLCAADPDFYGSVIAGDQVAGLEDPRGWVRAFRSGLETSLGAAADSVPSLRIVLARFVGPDSVPVAAASPTESFSPLDDFGYGRDGAFAVGLPQGGSCTVRVQSFIPMAHLRVEASSDKLRVTPLSGEVDPSFVLETVTGDMGEVFALENAPYVDLKLVDRDEPVLARMYVANWKPLEVPVRLFDVHMKRGEVTTAPSEDDVATRQKVAHRTVNLANQVWAQAGVQFVLESDEIAVATIEDLGGRPTAADAPLEVQAIFHHGKQVADAGTLPIYFVRALGSDTLGVAGESLSTDTQDPVVEKQRAENRLCVRDTPGLILAEKELSTDQQRQNTAAHELGHALGLGHIMRVEATQTPLCRRSLMRPSGDGHTIWLRKPADDFQNTKYPPDNPPECEVVRRAASAFAARRK